MTNLGTEHLEGLPHVGCLHRVSPAHNDAVVIFVVLWQVTLRQCAAGTLLGARDARELHDGR
jgi:hypothetical protein